MSSEDPLGKEGLCVGQAKQIARAWVAAHGSVTPGFTGAFFHGSVNWLADDALLPATSDLDVMLVLQGDTLPPKPGKLLYEGVLLEISHISAAALESPHQVLAEYNLAGSFHTPSILLDRTGHLTRLQASVAREYAQRRWVRVRAEQALRKSQAGLEKIDAAAPFHEQVTAWLFGTGVMTHVLLVAGLKNPTVRTRYLAVRSLLEEYGRPDFYATLLSLLDLGRFTTMQARMHLEALAHAYDAAASVIRSPFPFAADINALSRPVAIDGSRVLIEQGMHREAIFWLVATYSRCMQVLYRDTPEGMQWQLITHEEGYRHLLRSIGITSRAGLHQRAAQSIAILPNLWSVAEDIMNTNPRLAEESAP